jgi:hypothetical protein
LDKLEDNNLFIYRQNIAILQYLIEKGVNMAKKKKPQEQVLKFDTIRPFGPTIMRGKMPDFITEMLDKKATEMLTDEK